MCYACERVPSYDLLSGGQLAGIGNVYIYACVISLSIAFFIYIPLVSLAAAGIPGRAGSISGCKRVALATDVVAPISLHVTWGYPIS